MKQFIFGYGSLVTLASIEASLKHRLAVGDYYFARLNDWQRMWSLFVDNNDERIIRYFTEPSTGKRADVLIRTLDINPRPGSYVNGVIYSVTMAELKLLDEREDIYQRVDVTSSIAPAHKESKVWAYRGRDDVRSQYATGDKAIIPRAYFDGVIGGFDAIDQKEEFLATTTTKLEWIRELNRIT
jgi:hypothetical protein